MITAEDKKVAYCEAFFKVLMLTFYMRHLWRI